MEPPSIAMDAREPLKTSLLFQGENSSSFTSLSETVDVVQGNLTFYGLTVGLFYPEPSPLHPTSQQLS